MATNSEPGNRAPKGAPTDAELHLTGLQLHMSAMSWLAGADMVALVVVLQFPLADDASELAIWMRFFSVLFLAISLFSYLIGTSAAIGPTFPGSTVDFSSARLWLRRMAYPGVAFGLWGIGLLVPASFDFDIRGYVLGGFFGVLPVIWMGARQLMLKAPL